MSGSLKSWSDQNLQCRPFSLILWIISCCIEVNCSWTVSPFDNMNWYWFSSTSSAHFSTVVTVLWFYALCSNTYSYCIFFLFLHDNYVILIYRKGLCMFILNSFFISWSLTLASCIWSGWFIFINIYFLWSHLSVRNGLLAHWCLGDNKRTTLHMSSLSLALYNMHITVTPLA